MSTPGDTQNAEISRLPGTPARRAETTHTRSGRNRKRGAVEEITLDVRIKGGSRPMRLPLRSSVREIIDSLCASYHFEDIYNVALYAMRSGIWLAPNRTLSSFWLDNLEEIVVSEKHDPSDAVHWSVMLPNGQVEEVCGTTRTTTRGIIQLVPLKPDNFHFDSAELYIRDQTLEGGWRLLPANIALLGIQAKIPENTLLRLLTPDVDWDNVSLKRLGSLNPSFSTGDLDVPTLISCGSTVSTTYADADDRSSELLLNDILDQMEHQEFVSRNRVLPSPVEVLPRSPTEASERHRSSSHPTNSVMRRSSSHDNSLSPRKSENLANIFLEYPAFEDLLRVANEEREATRQRSLVHDQVGKHYPARVALTQGEIRLKVLVEFTSKVCEVVCDLKGKVLNLVHLVLDQLDIEVADSNVSLFLPAQKSPVPFSSTLKSLGLRDEDLLILASKQSTSLVKKKKPKVKSKPLNLLPRVTTLVRDGPQAPRGQYHRFESPVNSPDRTRAPAPAPFQDASLSNPDPPEVHILERFINCLVTLGGITTEGIFRMSASSRIVEEVHEKALSSAEHLLDVYKVHEVACALKKYLRETKPIIPDDMKAALIAAHDGVKVDEQQVHEILSQLPEDSAQCFQVILPFLYSISEHSHLNLMGLPNLSIIFSPIFLQDPLFDIARATMFAEITGALILSGAPPVHTPLSDASPPQSPPVSESKEQQYTEIQELLTSADQGEKTRGVHRAQTLLQDSAFVEHLQSQSPVLLVMFLQQLADCAASLIPPLAV